jgi:DNA-directed RNA polymerase delta subunit
MMQDVVNALQTMERTINDMLAKVSQMKTAANLMAASAGLPEPYADVEAEVHSGAFRVRSDQFVSEKAPASAARAYLALRGKERGATSADDIYDALVRGGYDFGKMKENEAKGGLRIALAKDGKVHRLRNGHYGLREWYGIDDEERVERDKTADPKVGSNASSSRKKAKAPGAAKPANDDADEGDEQDSTVKPVARSEAKSPKSRATGPRGNSTGGGD